MTPSRLAELLPDRHHVGEGLARMEFVGQAVDDGDARGLGERVDLGLVERPDHDPVDVAREDEPCVLDRLAAAQLEISG